ncbi:MAG: hypothetical protein IT288_17005 [Bdellovibrionales bacterium]|nr:hypothetical protein [Bdellovibrionales bacterium]
MGSQGADSAACPREKHEISPKILVQDRGQRHIKEGMAENVRHHRKRDRCLSLIASLIPGVVAFLTIFGWDKLNPLNIAWLLRGDMGSHFLGWLFFKNSAWHFPIGHFDTWLAPFGTNVVLTDSIPLLAIPLKLIKDATPQVYQYIGCWLFLSFVLMGLYAFRVCQALGGTKTQSILISLIFVFAPPLCFRVEHVALSSQWLIMAPLYQAIRMQTGHCLGIRDRLELAVIAIMSLLIQPYLFAMVFPLVVLVWFGVPAKFEVRLLASLKHRLRTSNSLLYAHVLLVLGLVFWAVGYGQNTTRLTATDFGSFSADLLTFFNSMGHSLILPRLRTSWGQYEGFAYLGLGQLLLFASKPFGKKSQSGASGVQTIQPGFLGKGWWTMVGLLALYALSGSIRFGGNDLIDVSWFWSWFSPLPDMFRSSGRFIWPMYYSIMVVTASNLISLDSKFPKKLLAIGLIVGIQLGDMMPAFIGLRNSWDRPLPNHYKTISTQYDGEKFTNLVMVPARVFYGETECGRLEWSEFEFFGTALFAAEKGVRLNSGFSARVPAEQGKSICNLSSDHLSNTLLIRLIEHGQTNSNESCHSFTRFQACYLR